MEPDYLSLLLFTCFYGLLAATNKRHKLLVTVINRPQPLVAWLFLIGPDSNTPSQSDSVINPSVNPN